LYIIFIPNLELQFMKVAGKQMLIGCSWVREDFWDTLCSKEASSCQPSQLGKLVPTCALSIEQMLEGTNSVCVLQALHWSTLLG